MRIIEQVPEREVLKAIVTGSHTTWGRESNAQREYVCIACSRTFYSDGLICHSLCEDNFARFNMWVVTERMKGGYPGVQEWLAYRDVSQLRIRVIPVGPVCKLSECPPGLFLVVDDLGNNLGLKTEYSSEEVFVVVSGEYFWGGVQTDDARQNLRVVPCEYIVGRLHDIKEDSE